MPARGGIRYVSPTTVFHNPLTARVTHSAARAPRPLVGAHVNHRRCACGGAPRAQRWKSPDNSRQ